MAKWNYPELVVGAVVLNRRKQVLIVRTWKWPGLYAIPGGHVEIGESVENAAKREVLEEVGLKIAVGRTLNVQEAIYPMGFHQKRHFLFIDVLCTSNGDKVKIDNNEIQDYIWIEPRKALKLNLNVYTRRAMVNLLEKDAKWFYSDSAGRRR